MRSLLRGKEGRGERERGGKREIGSGRSLSLKGTFAPGYGQGTACHAQRGDCAMFPRGSWILTPFTTPGLCCFLFYPSCPSQRNSRGKYAGAEIEESQLSCRAA